MVSFASLRMTWYFEGRAYMTTPEPQRTVQSPENIRKALRAVKDPELNLNIIDIGLVYDIESSDEPTE